MDELELAAAWMSAAASAVIFLEEDMEDKKKKLNRLREWVKSWRMRRETVGAFNFVHQELRLEDKNAYRQYLRMDEKSILKVLGYIEEFIKKMILS